MRSALNQRLTSIRQTLDRSWVKVLGGILTIVGIYDSCISQLLPEEAARKWPKIYQIVIATSGFLRWEWWVLIAAAFVAVVSLEYTFRHTNPRERGNDHRATQYLGDRDAELSHAIFLMGTISAWGRWFSAQYIADSGKPIDERYLMTTAAFQVLQEAMDGALEIRGRPANGVDYEPIPREAWRLVYFDAKPDARILWKFTVKPRSGISPERVNQILSYDSLIVESQQFQQLWPRKDAATDAATTKLLKKARENGADTAAIERLSF